MEIQWGELLSKNAPFIFSVLTRERNIDIFLRQAPTTNEYKIRVIRGKNCDSTSELFHEFSSALQFPYYFGKNWDAFDECISDLDWLKCNIFILFITGIELLLKNEDPKEFDTFLSIINSTIHGWQEKGSFKVVFQAETEIDPRIKVISTIKKLKSFDDVQ